jgi:tetratricopeptide (TPR) repeat protein
MKDVARFRQRQGGILEARGDRGAALAAYEEALRVNPTDVSTMTGLGRLYFAQKEWEKARRIYQSLVLQNIDPDAGVTKGEVYWALGTIHLQLGQPPKAKSMFQRGLELEPSNQQLRDALASLG